MALSYLVTEPGVSKYEPATHTIASHEAPALVDLLSHCLHGLAKEGPGGYSAAAFTLKAVLYGIRCILSELRNRELFAESASKLNLLLLKSVARFSFLDNTKDIIDAEAAEHAVVSLHFMTLMGLDDSIVGSSTSIGRGIFFPATIGDKEKTEAKSTIAKVLTWYLDREDVTKNGRHAASQVLFRLNVLRFEGDLVSIVLILALTYLLRAL